MSQIVTLPPEDTPTEDGIRAGGWWHASEDGRKVVCDLCPRGCVLGEGDRGFCFVRQNLGGQMVSTTYGRSTGFCIDPIEKKPLNQFYPGTAVLSFGTAGCNLGCKFCQNWTMSKSRQVDIISEQAMPADIAAAAQKWNCRSVAFTYNDPVVWAEYAIDTAKACHELGIKTVAVTAGYITPIAREPFFAVMDAANVDLKGYTETFYWKLSAGHLEPVLDTIRWIARETDVWMEITNLVIPQANDSMDEIARMCDWLLENVGPDVPLHFTAFHPDFRLMDRGPTPPSTLTAAWEIARRAGLRYVYTGNVHDPRHQSTYCPSCGRVVIQRDGYHIGVYDLRGDACRHCGARIAGRFGDAVGDWGPRRMPVRIEPQGEAKRKTVAPARNAKDRSNQADARGPASQEQASPPSSETAVADKSQTLGDPPMTAENPAPKGDTASSQRPTLTGPQEQLVLRTAAQRVAAAVRGESFERLDKLLGEVAKVPLLGAFVSLKRSGQLRSCCGFLGTQAPLHEALDHAAVRAAKDDPRFPPISPAELPYLDVEVWLLWNMQPVAAQGKDRIHAVEVGKHGLQISRGGHRGLLLPSVPVEHGWDAETFLRQVCVKAGLPPEAWKERDAKLSTFEGYSIRGAMGEMIDEPDLPANSGGPTAADLAALADFCRANIVAHYFGATPNYYAPGTFDGGAHGIVVSVALPGRVETVDASALSVRSEMPLQATLVHLTKAAAEELIRARVDPRDVEQALCGLSVFWDPAMQGTLEKPDLAGIDPRRRAVAVLGPSHWALAYDPDKTPEALLDVCSRRIAARGQGTVCSLEARSTQPRVLASSLPASRTVGAVRPPAVAGRFYPASPEAINQMLDQLLPPQVSRGRWSGVLVPHAGWVYSGRLAAQALSRVEIPDRVLIVCPKHRPGGAAWAVAACGGWGLPGQVVPTDLELARDIAESVEGMALDNAAHAEEHAIEVQLPILARLAPSSRVIGVAIHGGDWERLARAAQQLAAVLRKLPDRPLLVISSDMNHYADDDSTRRVDRMALDAIESLDPRRLLDTVTQNRISMCGVLPAVLVMETLRHLGALTRCELVGYTTSAEASGDRRQVVGYAAALFA